VVLSYSEICAAVEKIRRKYDEDDPVRLCHLMDIKLLYESFGRDEDAIKGFFVECKRIKTITVNSDLPDVIQSIIVAHELGHAVLHNKLGIHAFHDIGLFDESSILEKDANLFAAEYLLQDEDVLAALNDDSTFFAAASKLYVPIELLDFKFRVLKWKGYKIMEPPITARSNFLRDMEVPDHDIFFNC
jgi:Zn-dependent peptidase ImmA (M78 family)